MRDNLSREKMHKAVDSTLSGLQGDPWLFQHISSRASEGEIIVQKKISVGLVLAIVLLLAAVTAFAITNGFGLLDFWKNTWGDAEIPADAGKYIEHDTVTDETEHFTVCFRESSYDGKTCHVVYDVIPKSKDLFLFEGYLDENWYGMTHLNPDREKMKEDGRTILDKWNEGGFTSGWIVDTDAGSDDEDIAEYSSTGVLNEETGVYTGQITVPLKTLKEERTLWFSVRMLPLTDMQDENSFDYDHEENAYMERNFHAAVSGEEVILINKSPVHFSAIGVQVDQIRLMVLPQEIQYQIEYSVTDSALFHSLFDEHPDAEHTVTVHPSFRFIEADPESGKTAILPRGVTENYTGYDIDEKKGQFRQTGSLGRTYIADTYTLGAYRAVYMNSPTPMESVTFQADVQNPDALTQEERVWQQESDRSKPHNQADDTFVNPTSDDLPEAEAVAIARSAIIQAYGLPEGALDHSRTVSDMYVTNQRPNYRRWFIQFQVLKEGSDDYVERFYSCIVDQEGRVIADPDIDEPSLEEKAAAMTAALQKEMDRPDYVKKYLEYFSAHENIGGFFWYWPYDVKVAYWQDMQPWINEVPLETDTEVGLTLYYAYGIPSADEFQHDEAIRIARDLIKEKYQLSDAQIEKYYSFCEAFDISGKLFDGNVWKFAFVEEGDRSFYDSPRYWIVLDAKTGNAVIIEDFQWQEFKKDLEYDLKYY